MRALYIVFRDVSLVVSIMLLCSYKTQEKCGQYRPKDQAPEYFSDVMVTLLKETNRGMYIVREMQVTSISVCIAHAGNGNGPFRYITAS